MEVVNNVYIISYFRNINRRKVYFKRNIDLYTKLGYNIVILWMNSDRDKILQSNITYIDSIRVYPSVARNKLLKIFYNSNLDEALFSDDDIIIEDETTLDNEIGNYDVLSFITGRNNNIRSKIPAFSGGLFKIKNFVKLDKEYYFDETLKASEDLDFGLLLYHSGKKIKMIQDGKTYNDIENSSLFPDKVEKKTLKKEAFKIIINKYK